MFTPGKIMTLFAVSGACCFGMLWAQQDEAGQTTREVTVRDAVKLDGRNVNTTRIVGNTVTTTGPDTVGDEVAEVRYFPGQVNVANVYSRRGQPDNGLGKALKAYRDSKPDSTERKEARDKVAKGLSDQYDDQLKRQEQQIEELAERLEKLRTQLGKRREAKARMVELKLEMVLSQAEGLGWPEDSSWLGSNPFGQQNFLYSTSPLDPMPAMAPLPPVAPAISPDLNREAPEPSAPARATSPRR